MLSAESVELSDDIGNLHLFAVNTCGNACLECHGHIFTFIGCLLGSDAENEEMIVIGLVCGILKLKSLMAYMPDIAVAAVGTVCREGKVDPVLAAVFDLGLAGIESPLFVSPRSDDLEIGSESLDPEFKTYLVVSFTGCTVADSGSSLFSCYLYKPFCDKGPCHRCAQKVLILINSACLYAGHDVIVTEFICYIFDVKL